MAGSEVATREESAVPDLVRTPALEIDVEDVILPRLKIGQFMTPQVRKGLAGAGDIFSTETEEDATTLWKFGSKDDGVLLYIVGLRKAKSLNVDGELQLFEWGDPEAPSEAWTTYNYTAVLPEVDPDVPFKLLLSRTGRPAAQRINTVLKKNTVRGPAWINAFRLTSSQRENAKGEFFVPTIELVESSPDQIEVAEKLAVLVSSQPAEVQATGEEPAI